MKPVKVYNESSAGLTTAMTLAAAAVDWAKRARLSGEMPHATASMTFHGGRVCEIADRKSQWTVRVYDAKEEKA